MKKVLLKIVLIESALKRRPLASFVTLRIVVMRVLIPQEAFKAIPCTRCTFSAAKCSIQATSETRTKRRMKSKKVRFVLVAEVDNSDPDKFCRS